MERRVPLITDYVGIIDPEERRKAISSSKSEKVAAGRIQTPDVQHNYSGDSVFVKLDEEGNWESDFFVIPK